MARPPSITDEEILASARAVFLDKGITATVEDVAERCGVGEATVFRRFPTKEALFLAAMDTSEEPSWVRTLADKKDAEDVREALLELATQMLQSARKMLPLFLMRISNPAVGPPGPPERIRRALGTLSDFFAGHIKAGRINGSDPRVTARVWLGAIQHFVLFESLSKAHGKGFAEMNADVYLEGLVDMFCVPRKGARKR